MKAALCREFGKPLCVEEIEISPPGAGEIMVELGACAICHSDIHYAEGAWGGDLPAVYGHEAAGTVCEVGAGVAGFRTGDHVVVTLIRSCGRCHHCARGELVACQASFPLDATSPLSDADGATVAQGLATGAFAEYVVVDASQAVVVPDDLPFERASLLACGVITGVGAVVNTAKVPAGASVVVIGAGGVGLNSIQGAALCGAATIIAVDLSDEKLAAATDFGATHTLNAVGDDVRAGVKQLTGGRGADYVFVTVGAKEAFDSSYRLIGWAGTVVLVGMPASGVKSELDVLTAAIKSQRILGSRMGGARIAVDIPYLVSLYRQGRLKLDELISGRYPLAEINDAIAAVKRGRALRNVIVF